MNLEQRVQSFVILGRFLSQADTGKNPDIPLPLDKQHHKRLREIIREAGAGNPWFIDPFVHYSIRVIARNLGEENIRKWLTAYPSLQKETKAPRTVGVVMAGNIPLVGFHDLLCVLITGNRILIKPSSRDDKLIRFITGVLTAIDPGFASMIYYSEGIMKGFDAVIATGSDNSSRYFEYYFGKYPHIIRKNRSSLAIITGEETPEEMENLADDIFLYFGLGCRNVSMVFIPEGYDPRRIFDSFHNYSFVADHNRYANNYIYHRSIYQMNRIPHYDNGFILLREDDHLNSPPGVLHYRFYKDLAAVEHFISNQRDRIQCIVSISDRFRDAVPPGESQRPMLGDYADGIDTVRFLLNIM